MPQSRSSSLSSSNPANAPQVRHLKALGDDTWKNKVEKVNAEFFHLTYGTIVAQLCEEYAGDYARVNGELFQIGYNLGVRLIEDFLARTALPRCDTFLKTSEVVSKCAFKIFLNLTPEVAHWNAARDSFDLVFGENPLAEHVELPPGASGQLWFSNVLCGVLRGALEMVQLDCDVEFVSDTLRGDMSTDIRVKLNKVLRDEIPAGED
ncbi:TRAPP complex core subunit BET3 KNAG_0C06320 [Huiozyma naganishii CBS 8797]|uniref:Trafficking protein particle complex subunit BET3 n=1 Tax=Huiozyma naganishii (strain ATCC MYA-139 / BCRC 22969 / CBS 8797 / KCTC 17520 / NBRC 10181 / NCYC 3082 / Yp74L-3) TaxID=1071383 RepID=J7S6F2_HUIN7|nr:hypothetical protein KNAG_0C06320 [Kazachstania naganishii CBS 8797]CCK69726.1 hypothetical protein KNAG_0C06320 [Kazachstania naganishii CBS 8797]